MFEAFFTQTISVEDPQSEHRVLWRYVVGKEFELPFAPSAGMLFYDKQDEIDVEYVHWHLQDERFEVCCGGMLSHDEDCAKKSLEYELSKGWKLLRSRKA